MTRQEKLILFYVGLFSLALVLIAFFWNADKYYSNAYSPVVEKANRDRAIIEQNRQKEQRAGRSEGQGRSNGSNQPRPAGFREQDIDKKRGERFSTY